MLKFLVYGGRDEEDRLELLDLTSFFFFLPGPLDLTSLTYVLKQPVSCGDNPWFSRRVRCAAAKVGRPRGAQS
jgi:hypothetical protein